MIKLKLKLLKHLKKKIILKKKLKIVSFLNFKINLYKFKKKKIFK